MNSNGENLCKRQRPSSSLHTLVQSTESINNRCYINQQINKLKIDQLSNQLRKKIGIYSYVLNQAIGKGYSSTVYRGQNDITQQLVAIKVIDLKSLKDQATTNMLYTQIQCLKDLRQLESPYVLKFYDSYITSNNCYIITQYCNEGDLFQKLKSNKRFSEEQLINFFYQLYMGYKALSACGFIHRDLKPANVFIKDGKLKLADFGFVKSKLEHPKNNYNVGTPIYMAPEIMFANIYTQKSDIWSLGVICFELIHGNTPWKCTNEQEIKAQIHKPELYFDLSRVSFALQDFIQKCLNPNPAQRISFTQMKYHPWVVSILSKYNETAYQGAQRLQHRNRSKTITQKTMRAGINQMQISRRNQKSASKQTSLLITKQLVKISHQGAQLNIKRPKTAIKQRVQNQENATTQSPSKRQIWKNKNSCEENISQEKCNKIVNQILMQKDIDSKAFGQTKKANLLLCNFDQFPYSYPIKLIQLKRQNVTQENTVQSITKPAQYNWDIMQEQHSFKSQIQDLNIEANKKVPYRSISIPKFSQNKSGNQSYLTVQSSNKQIKIDSQSHLTVQSSNKQIKINSQSNLRGQHQNTEIFQTISSIAQQSNNQSELFNNSQSNSSKSRKQPLRIEIKLHKKSSQTILDNLLSILNYSRFLFKIHNLADRNKHIFSIQIKIDQLLIKIRKQLYLLMKKHETLITYNTNQFLLQFSAQQWAKFCSSSKFLVYKSVINQYIQRYQQVTQEFNASQNTIFSNCQNKENQAINYQKIDQMSNKITKQIRFDSLSQLTSHKQMKQNERQLNENISEAIMKIYQQLDNQYNFDIFRFKKLEILDSLIVLYQLLDLAKKGWASFTKNSNISKIVQSTCLVDEWSFPRVLYEVGQKIAKLRA